MPFAFHFSSYFIALSLSLINPDWPARPAWAQTQSASNPSTSPEINELATALAGAASEEEQERLLARKNNLMNSSLLAALKALADPLVQKGDFAQALKISQLAANIAERIGDRVGLGDALCDLGVIYKRQNRAEKALDSYQKS